MAFNQLRKRIGPLAAGEHVSVVEREHRAQRLQQSGEGLHARVQTRRACSGREQETAFGMFQPFHSRKAALPAEHFPLFNQLCGLWLGRPPPLLPRRRRR